jgi:hypothetical protein
MNRYDNYLSKNLPKYIENDLIFEIIIQDENGSDIDKIKNSSLNLEKVKLYKNQSVLGPFLNKIEVSKKANKKWVALIDSDNFADYDYFLKMKEFIEGKKLENNTIVSPDYASEVFEWKYLSGTENNLINKTTYKKINIINEDYIKKNPRQGSVHHLFNLGNFVINKYLIENINLEGLDEIIKNSHSFDVCLFLRLCFEQLDLNFFLVNDCKYKHITSEDSIYMKYWGKNKNYADSCYSKIYEILNK